MFTIKLIGHTGFRTRILSAESLTILDNGPGYEVTLHQKNASEDARFDVADSNVPRGEHEPAAFETAIIENAAGKTTQILRSFAKPRSLPSQPPGD